MNQEKLRRCAGLFGTFFKIGAFTFGGGYAMIPLIQKEAAERKQWVTEEEILDIVAIAETTPGPIAINAATFIGYRTAGVAGAFCATLGVVLPSFVIISAAALILQRLEQFRAVQYAFLGIRAGVLALIVKALVSMFRKCPKNAVSYAIMALAFLWVVVLKASVLPGIALCGFVGWVTSLLMARKQKPKEAGEEERK